MTGELEVLSAALKDRYAIERVAGVGGMATVYQGRDLRHSRAVAIKVLKPQLAAVLGAERFLAEIAVTASLQHPNILPLYDSGEAGGLLYYVMPFVDGQSLRDRLNREKVLPINEAVDIARAIASAIDVAHEQGIIHRDLKPENILLQRGQALVTDFGIALAMRAANSPRLTETGLSLGTPAYMSPEQALGDQDLDARTDVYSLGAMLFEMIAGHPPFTAATAQGVVAKVIAEPPASLTAERSTVPEHVSAAVRIALEKLPADRFPTARAFAEALTNPAFSALNNTRATRARASVRQATWRERWTVPALGLSVLGFAAAALSRLWSPAPAAATLRYTVSLPPEQSLQVRYASRIAISPDGTRLVYVGPGEQGVRLYLRDRSQFESAPIAGTEGAVAPFFSPDGEEVGFLNSARNSLDVVTLRGGAVRTVVPSGVRRVGAAWDKRGIVYVDDAKGLVRWSRRDSSTTVLLPRDIEPDPRQPTSDPSGDVVLYRKLAGTDGASELWRVLDGKSRPLARGMAGTMVDAHTLIFVTSAGRLVRADVDVKNAAIRGNEVELGDRVEVRFDAVDLGISSRAIAYGVRAADDLSDLVIVQANGAVRPVDDTWMANFQTVEFSPDGKRLAATVAVSAREAGVWVKQLSAGAPTQVTPDGTLSFRGTWHPDGRQLGFIRQTGEAREFWVNPSGAPGTAAVRQRLDGSKVVNEAAWSPDGRWVVFRTGLVSGFDVKAFRQSDSTILAVAAAPNASEHSPALSPDGKWIAYVSDRANSRYDVYVRRFPAVDRGEWPASIGGGTEPRWSPNGRELYYKQGSRLMALTVGSDSVFTVLSRRTVMAVDGYYNFLFHPTYDVSREGAFAMIRPRHRGQMFDVALIDGWRAVGR
jgi:Tol biopolymer transport system component